jgi:hypothetical protein
MIYVNSDEGRDIIMYNLSLNRYLQVEVMVWLAIKEEGIFPISTGERTPPGCRARTTRIIVAPLTPVAPDFHPKNHRRCNRCK